MTPMTRTKTDDMKQIWWGRFEFREEHAGCWNVGPSTLWIYRSARSWHLVHLASNDSLMDTASISSPDPIEDTSLSLEDLPTDARHLRFSFLQTDSQCTLIPTLADRAVVVRPDTPLYILAGEAVTLYVSTPLWIRVEVGAPPRLLQEIPSFRPSDTWFGPSTREGELCYMVKTVGRLRLASLPFRLHRAITPIVVRNRGSDAMLVDSIQLPVQYLSLHEADNHFLWTEAVTLDRQDGGEMAAVRFERRPPSEAGETKRLRGPRLELRANMIVRTFSSIFSRLSNES